MYIYLCHLWSSITHFDQINQTKYILKFYYSICCRCCCCGAWEKILSIYHKYMAMCVFFCYSATPPHKRIHISMFQHPSNCLLYSDSASRCANIIYICLLPIYYYFCFHSFHAYFARHYFRCARITIDIRPHINSSSTKSASTFCISIFRVWYFVYEYIFISYNFAKTHIYILLGRMFCIFLFCFCFSHIYFDRYVPL